MPIELTPIPASDTYSADADLDNAYGRDDVTAWADLNSNADAGEITARKAWGRGEAKILIDEQLTDAGLTTPATAGNFRNFASLKSIEAELAGVLLYQSRGITDPQQAGSADGAMEAHYKRAMDRLAARIEGQQINATEVSGGIDGISVIGPATGGACCGGPGCGGMW